MPFSFETLHLHSFFSAPRWNAIPFLSSPLRYFREKKTARKLLSVLCSVTYLLIVYTINTCFSCIRRTLSNHSIPFRQISLPRRQVILSDIPSTRQKSIFFLTSKKLNILINSIMKLLIVFSSLVSWGLGDNETEFQTEFHLQHFSFNCPV